MYTVKQVAQLANISIRTLHYYDEIGLLRPSKVGGNQYRYYDEAALLRLQQILLYRELGMELSAIKGALDTPNFDVVAALKAHRHALEARQAQLAQLLHTIDSTIHDLEKGTSVNDKKKLFQGFSEAKQKEYEREIRLEYGPTLVNESVRRWGSYSAAEKQAVMEEGNHIYSAIVTAIEQELPHSAPEVQALMERWHNHIRYFYEPTLDILRGLGELYTTHPDFIANFAAMHERLGDYIKAAINIYVDALETAAIEQMLAEDEQQRRQQNS